MNTVTQKVPSSWQKGLSEAACSLEGAEGASKVTLHPSEGSVWLEGGGHAREGAAGPDSFQRSNPGLRLSPSVAMHPFPILGSELAGLDPICTNFCLNPLQPFHKGVFKACSHFTPDI